MKRLLNFSTHPGEPEVFDDDWRKAGDFLEEWGFDGFELYPVGDYPCEIIPAGIVAGLHLRFFVILAPIWRGDHGRLLQIFGDWQTVERYYGGRDAEWIATFYARQLDLARHLGCGYVVFHPVHCELEHVYNWRFPWRVEDTLDMCAEVINAASRASAFEGWILFENLWWPGSFRLDSPAEYEYLLERVHHPRCGIALDTGHLLNKNPSLGTDEDRAIDYLLGRIESLGETAKHIRTVHLTKSLSGEYIRSSQQIADPYQGTRTFWERLNRARKHVSRIDRHEPFEHPRIAEVLQRADPDQVVFEYTFKNKGEWRDKIARQKRALQGYLWPPRERDSLTGRAESYADS